jgi:hypothetical protein
MKAQSTGARAALFILLAAVACETPAQSLRVPGSIWGSSALPNAGWRFLPSAGIAYDSFGQKYVLADNDTLDLVDELSGRFSATLEHLGRTELRLRNTFSYGQQARRNDMQLWLQRRGPVFELRLDEALRYKGYRDPAQRALSSDYLVNTLRPEGIWRLGSRWKLRLDDRFEWAGFDKRNAFNYDYTVNDLGAEAERGYGLFSLVRGGYVYGFRAVPDSSALAYRRHVLLGEWLHEAGPLDVDLTQRLERRVYRDSGVRSAYLNYDSGLALRAALHPRLRLRPEYRADLLHYDTPNSIYAPATEQSVEMLLEGDLSESTTLALGPRAEFRRVASNIDRAYNQWGLKGSVTFLDGTRFWIQFTDEVGVRKHLAGDATLYSDYLFNWSTLYMTWEPMQRLQLELFFSINPETHDDKTNDTTTILVSTALTYGWH